MSPYRPRYLQPGFVGLMELTWLAEGLKLMGFGLKLGVSWMVALLCLDSARLARHEAQLMLWIVEYFEMVDQTYF